MPPEFGRARRQERFGDLDDLTHERLGLRAEGEFEASGRAEEIGGDRVAAAFDIFEKERGAAPLDNAAVYFRQFEIRVDFRFDDGRLFFASQEFEEGTKVSVHVGIKRTPPVIGNALSIDLFNFPEYSVTCLPDAAFRQPILRLPKSADTKS